MKEKVYFTSGNNVLAANVYIPVKKHKQKGLLFLHGGGTATKERYSDMQQYFVEKGYPSFAFDFQGVGESEGSFVEGSLDKRLADAVAAYHAFEKYTNSIVVVGCSMGGHVAARLSEQVTVAGLIFLYAAAYPEQAENKRMNTEFSDSIRNTEKWKMSPAFSALRKYQQNVLIIYGGADTVIPKGVQSMYSNSVPGPRRVVVIPNAPHLLLSDEAARKVVYTEIENYFHTV